MAIRTFAQQLTESTKPTVNEGATKGTITVPAVLAPRLLMLERSLTGDAKAAVNDIHAGKAITEGVFETLVSDLYKLSDGAAGPLAARLSTLVPKKVNESAKPATATPYQHKLIKESTQTRSGKMFVPPVPKTAKVSEMETVELIEGLCSGRIKNIKWRDVNNVVVEGYVVAVNECKGAGTIVTAVTADHRSDVRLHVRDVIR